MDEEGLEYSDVYPLQFTVFTASSFSHEDASNNKQTAASSSTFILNDFIKKPWIDLIGS